MAVNPLDLQVSFSQMNQVGKQQSSVKESDDVKQEQASQLLNKVGAKEAEEVPETKDLKEGLGKIKDEERKKNRNKKKKLKDGKEDSTEEESEKEKSKEFKDPNLGQNIDILG